VSPDTRGIARVYCSLKNTTFRKLSLLPSSGGTKQRNPVGFIGKKLILIPVESIMRKKETGRWRKFHNEELHNLYSS
jgi:phosphoribosylaminoimidazole-succinocarboxamide synthase